MFGVAFAVTVLALCYSAQAGTLSKQFTFNPTIKQFTLDLHNNYRKQVASGQVARQPKASNLGPLVWDDGLAAKAKAWSERCQLQHSNTSDGENYAAHGLMAEIKNDNDLKTSIQQGFTMWSDEAKDFTYPKSCNGVCGHYTQLVWADTKKVGCGLAQCNGLFNWNGPSYVMFCNYNPPGNYNNQDPYKRA